MNLSSMPERYLPVVSKSCQCNYFLHIPKHVQLVFSFSLAFNLLRTISCFLSIFLSVLRATGWSCLILPTRKRSSQPPRWRLRGHRFQRAQTAAARPSGLAELGTTAASAASIRAGAGCSHSICNILALVVTLQTYRVLLVRTRIDASRPPFSGTDSRAAKY